jgi:HEAT repeat protein
MLQQLMASQAPAERLQVAEAMAHRPDAGWMDLVLELSREPDPEIQAACGRLLGPHHPEMARAILEPLLRDENPAIRELASQGLGEALPNDLTGLRRVMRDAASLITRVRASARVLSLTR